MKLVLQLSDPSSHQLFVQPERQLGASRVWSLRHLPAAECRQRLGAWPLASRLLVAVPCRPASVRAYYANLMPPGLDEPAVVERTHAFFRQRGVSRLFTDSHESLRGR